MSIVVSISPPCNKASCYFWASFFILFFLPPSLLAQNVTDVRIEKAERVLRLMNNGSVLREFKIALGGEPVGPKQCEGDEKTPEGDFIISGRNAQSSFHKSLRVSYPSDENRKKAAALGCPPGGNILIHGLPRGRGWLGAMHRAIDWTRGCIAVTNKEIEEIWKLVPDGTPVHISP